MIRLHVNAILTVRDAFTGKEPMDKGLAFMLDGQRILPEKKPGGVYVLLNLTPGEHVLSIVGTVFRTEILFLHCDDASRTEQLVLMKPNDAYPFGSAVTQLRLLLTTGQGKDEKPLANALLCLAAKSIEMKIAQEEVEEGACALRLFLRGRTERLQLPAQFFVQDGKQSEICTLLSLHDELGALQGPLAFRHKRGKTLLPCRMMRSDAAGIVTVYYREPAVLILFLPDEGKEKLVELSAGENSLKWNL